MSRFITELKRRNVFRAAVLYIAAAWVAVQVVDIIGDWLQFPDSTRIYVLVVLAAGFPVALLLSWFYQITSEGISEEADSDSTVPIPQGARRRSDKIIIAILAFAVLLFAVDKLIPGTGPGNVEPLYKLGREQLIARTETSVVEAEQNFRRAIELDKNFAPAYAGLAEALSIQAFMDLIPRQAALEQVRGIVKTGLDLDPGVGELYANLANVKWEIDDDLDAADQLYEQALQLSPDWMRGYQWYAEFLTVGIRQFDKAHAVLFTGLEEKPFDPLLVDRVIWVAIHRGNIADYEDLLRESIRRHPDFLKNYTAVIQILIQRGHVGEALKWSEYRSQVEPENFSRRILHECWARMLLEQHEEARACVEKLQQDFAAEPRKVMIAKMFLGDDIEETIQAAESLMASGPASSVMHFNSPKEKQLVGLLSGLITDQLVEAGKWDLAKRFKEWEDDPVFTDPAWTPSAKDVNRNSKIIPAILNAAILYRTENKENGEKLFDLALERIIAEDLETEAGYSYRVIWTHAFRGDAETTKSYIDVAMRNKGHLEDWPRLRGPVFDLVKDDPRWKAVLADLEARAAAELAWYEENKDEPLF